MLQLLHKSSSKLVLTSDNKDSKENLEYYRIKTYIIIIMYHVIFLKYSLRHKKRTLFF